MINLKKINKKGFLLGEETVKIVIALIVVIVLIVLLVNLYMNQANAAKQKQAIDVLEDVNKVKGRLTSLKLNGSSEDLDVQAPKGWYFITFTGEEIKPNDCRGMNCLCICDSVWGFNLFDWSSKRDRQAEECNENGACLSIDTPDFFKLKDYYYLDSGEKVKEITDATKIKFVKEEDRTSIVFV